MNNDDLTPNKNSEFSLKCFFFILFDSISHAGQRV